MAKAWVQHAVKHPGAEKAAAKARGLSTLQEAEREEQSSNPSIRARGQLAERFIHGDMHRKGHAPKRKRS